MQRHVLEPRVRVCESVWSSGWLLRRAVRGAQHQTVQVAADCSSSGPAGCNSAGCPCEMHSGRKLREHCNTPSALSKGQPVIAHERCMGGQGPGVKVQTAWGRDARSMPL